MLLRAHSAGTFNNVSLALYRSSANAGMNLGKIYWGGSRFFNEHLHQRRTAGLTQANTT